MLETNQSYNKAIDDVNSELADFYDECYKKNPINAKKNISTTICKLKERIDKLKTEGGNSSHN